MPNKAPTVDLADFKIDDVSPEELLALVKKGGGQRAFARKTGVPRTTIQKALYKMRSDPFTHKPAPQARIMGDGERRRYILTSAQDGTVVHEGFLANLEAYRDWLAKDAPCELLISGFSYNKRLFEQHNKKEVPYHHRVVKYLSNERLRLCDRVDFCGEMNTLPTAEKPLSGFHSYTRERWGIFPHAKVQLQSIPTMKGDPAKIIMTTGACTRPNYVQKKAGIKASFHHIYGAVLVEIDTDGTFFCRHLLGCDDTGEFYDLDRHIADAKVSTGHRVEAMTPGDLHVFQIDPTASKVLFGMGPVHDSPLRQNGVRPWEYARGDKPCVLDYLRPKYLFAHDLLDFRVRNHHGISDPHDRFFLYVNGTESVEDECRETAMFATQLAKPRPWMQMVVVESNHDQALMKWLRTADWRYDPANAIFYHKAQARVLEAIRDGEHTFSIFEHIMKNQFEPWRCEGIRFLREDESFRVSGVEHSYHGHRGLNGARGSTEAYTKVGPKVTKGHGHSATIIDGVYESGTTSKLDLQYNVGPGSWSHSVVIQYRDGKRAMLTLQNGRAYL